ncbi:Hypothetical predicted protein [Lecanosticta acicola]|uniref:F-box domain-containing protein n=1 Tax=Lecanosticta acicola TaxID=111012 RepID=A0AAI9E8E4_9PEZI|nr:Hypothetical predicted protein [Lecanosticta acicola]
MEASTDALPFFLLQLTTLLARYQTLSTPTPSLVRNKMQFNRLDTYWGILDPAEINVKVLWSQILAGGYHIYWAVSRETIVHLKQKVDQGLLVYEKCPLTLLRQFAADRLLVPPTDCANGRRQMVNFLTEADDDARFERLMDLPIELRNEIFMMYLAEFHPAHNHPNQPPLARTSRQVRAEILPWLYVKRGTATITLDYHKENDLRLHVRPAVQGYFSRMSAERFVHIRPFEFPVMKRRYRRGYGPTSNELAAKIILERKKHGKFSIEVCFWSLDWNGPRRRNAITREIEKALEISADESGREQKLTQLDIPVICERIEQAYHLKPEYAGVMQKLEFVVWLSNDNDEISITKQEDKYMVKAKSSNERLRATYVSTVQKLVDQVAARSEGGKLETEDIFKIRRAIEEVYRERY